MPYKSNSDLPESVRRNLPAHGLDIYREAFNHAFEEYASPSSRKGGASQEETAHKVAWSAVKKKYKKDAQGEWVEKK